MIDALSAVILPRLTGIAVEQTGWREPQKYGHDKIPKDLGENDHVLVAYGTVHAMYVQYSYTRADRAKFREMVVTGVIEPKTVEHPPISKLMVVAECVANNYQRIREAKKLIESTTETDKESKVHLESLVNDFTTANESQIRSLCLTPRTIDDALTKIEEELSFLGKEQKKNDFQLQIDENLKLCTNEEDRNVLAGRKEAIGQNIQQHERMLTSLATLREYILAPPC